MEEKKETKVAENVSSGAEKVETIEKTVQKKSTTPKKKQTHAPSSSKQSERVEKENEQAKARVAVALKKKEKRAKQAAARAKKREERSKARQRRAKLTVAERKAEARKLRAERKERIAKRIAEQKAKIAKKIAERKAKIAKKRAARKEQAEKHKAMIEARQRERAHKKANRTQERAKAQRQRKEKRQNGEKKGYGGWLAAVISLGAVTLGLTTAVTVGAIEMSDMQKGATANMQSTTYELIGIMEHVDDDLDRARIATSSSQQQRILTDLLVQARLAELDLEKLPIDGQADRNVTIFINRVGGACEMMLAKLRKGEPLSKADEQLLQRLYETNHAIRMQLDEYASKMTDKDVSNFMKKGTGGYMDMLNGLENLTLEENRRGMYEMNGGDKLPTSPLKDKKDEGKKIDTAGAEELCKRYFSDYSIADFQCVGETVGQGYCAYNVQGYDQQGTMLFAEIDCNGGELIRFDYFEPCEGEKFDMANAQTIAQNFLDKLGYADMTAVRTRENGTDMDFSFVYEMDGVVYYPDTVRVKVCRSRGVVTGFDASKYLQNHTQREEVQTGVTMEEAQSKLHTGLNVEHARLVVVKTMRGERSAYEFLCSYGDEKYLIYTDAVNGDEISILNIKNL